MNVSNFHTNRILVADTSVGALELLIKLSEKANCRVVPAQDGREAYRILKEDSSFIGAIFNLVMPYLDAPELIRFMKSENRLKQIPIMVMTDREDFALIEEAQRAGACGLIQQPFGASQCVAMMGLLASKCYRRPPGFIPRAPELKVVNSR